MYLIQLVGRYGNFTTQEIQFGANKMDGLVLIIGSPGEQL